MLIFYLLLALIVVVSLRYTKRDFNDGYLSFEMTNAVKGIFILLVFIKHAIPYVINSGWTPTGIWGECFLLINNNVGQWVVAMFLFYSGYGVMESIKRKGQNYVIELPQKRILQVLVNFDIAVLIFIVVDLILKKPLTIKQCFLSLIGWDSVGNSNWYIFIIVLMYLITFVAFYRDSKTYRQPLTLTVLLTLALCILLSYVKQEYWYNTMFCYTAGLFFSVHKNKVESLTKSYYWQMLITLLILLLIADRIPYSAKGLVYNAFAVVFCFIVVLLTMKFRINSPVLIWCGKNLFPLYIYQRVAMIVLSSIKDGAFAACYPVLFTASCFVITVVITMAYRFIAVKL